MFKYPIGEDNGKIGLQSSPIDRANASHLGLHNPSLYIESNGIPQAHSGTPGKIITYGNGYPVRNLPRGEPIPIHQTFGTQDRIPIGDPELVVQDPALDLGSGTPSDLVPSPPLEGFHPQGNNGDFIDY